MKIPSFISLFFLLSIAIEAQDITPFIIVDQFGYLPSSDKVAVIKNPAVGYDADQQYTPGNTYELIDAVTGDVIYSGNPVRWRAGETHSGSGDKIWHFDFSEIQTKGTFYVLDKEKNLRSYKFEIDRRVYVDVLKHAMRSFFYQRAGFAKEAPYADEGWIDGASHIGSQQDANCRRYNATNNSTTERDLSGGWYDAGDYNKYTNWTANYVVELVKAYQESPYAWGDDYNIPESGNGVPDILDEVKWGLDHLLRMQKEDGSVLSIVGMSHASPPSAATGRSTYGLASTSATQNTAAAFAISSLVFEEIGDLSYAQELESAAVAAYQWAIENPNVIFRNNDGANGSQGLGAGQQEEDDYGRFVGRMEAACYLFTVTEDEEYQLYFESNYQRFHLFEWNFAYPFEAENQEILLYYAQLENASTDVKSRIKSTYLQAMANGSENFPAYESGADPYFAHLKDYTWGSNGVKCSKGNMFYDVVTYDIDNNRIETAQKAAEGYIHYIHGVNPQSMVYLSNMYDYGGDNCVNEFYHTWFQNGSALWDRVGESVYGPAPGFLTGGPNPAYSRGGCCPSGCGGTSNNEVCDSEDLSPPLGQPDQKSYKDFNTSWPLNSWSVTENSNGYQVRYIKLLSKFVDLRYDCQGVLNGEASIDVCGTCAGGNTGLIAQTNPAACQTTPTLDKTELTEAPILFPNPNAGLVYFQNLENDAVDVVVYDVRGDILIQQRKISNNQLDISHLSSGVFFVNIRTEHNQYFAKLIKTQ